MRFLSSVSLKTFRSVVQIVSEGTCSGLVARIRLRDLLSYKAGVCGDLLLGTKHVIVDVEVGLCYLLKANICDIRGKLRNLLALRLIRSKFVWLHL